MKQSILGIMAFLLLLALIAAPEAGADTAFGYRMKITVNSSQVSNGPQTNFPFLFSTTNADTTNVKNKLRTTGNGGHVTSASGYDIIFRAMDTTTCGGTAPCTLNHEIEKYVATTGEFVAWVNVPSINTGTILYVYYGNASITTSQEHKTAVWDSNYKGVWHLANPSSATFSSAGSSSWTVPANVTSITVKAWGAGGGGGAGPSNGTRPGSAGGGGGFARGTIAVTPGQTLYVYVGGGGGGGTNAAAGLGGTEGGGPGGFTSGFYGGGGGGGFSGVATGLTFVVAGGGGGGGAGDSANGCNSGAGGAGGGINGGAGTSSNCSSHGSGGTQDGPGVGGGSDSTSGSDNAGGTGGTFGHLASGGGGGGGGKYGGGGGNNSSGGGGGSDLVSLATSTVETAGSGTTPGNNSDSSYTGTVGVGGSGGSSGSGADGNAGYVVITWGDSTSNANNLTINGLTAGTGEVDGGAVDNGSSYAKAGSAAINGNSSLTVEAWVKVANGYTTGSEIVGQYNTPASAAFDLWLVNTAQPRIYVYSGTNTITRTSSSTINDGNWHHVVGMFSGGSTLLEMYIDGALNNGTLSGTIPSATNSSTEPVQVGAYNWLGVDGNSPVTGSIDEIRVSASYRGADYVKTSYNNQSAPGSFYTLAGEESNPPTIITLSSFTVTEQGDHTQISWQTKSEVNNLGFNLYRTQPDGTGSVKLNGSLIPGLISAAIGKDYTYVDNGAKAGTTVCYVLEDIDLHEQSTYHGPACAYAPAQGSSTSSDTSVQDTTGGSSSGSGSATGSSGSTAGSQGTQGLSLPSSTGAVTQVTMRSLRAISGAEGVVIQWQTGLEVRNLGFHVYREDGSRRIRINHELILGSALIAGTHTILRSGHAYSFFDPGSSGGTYWIEDVDLSGQRMLHGPIVAAPGVLPEKKATVRPQILPRMRRLLANADFPGGNTPLATQWALAGIPSLKLLIKTEGIYRVSFRELADAGFDVRRPLALSLYVDGKEEPLLVTPTGIVFYATGVDTPFTDTRIYWLVNGLTPGKRIQQAGGIGTPGPVSFPATVTLKPRSFYFPALLNGDASNFFGNLIYQSGTTLTFTASHSTQGDAALDVRLQGVTTGHHTIQVTLNGSVVGNVVFDGQTPTDVRFPLAHSQLREGANELCLSASGEEDIAAVDTISLTYSRTYAAEGASLRFSAPGGSSITLTGFTAPVAIFDVTDTVTQISTQPAREGLRIRVPGKGTRTLYAVTDQGLLTPELSANIPSRWHNQRADLVIITHEDFKDSLTPLVQQRTKQGLSVAVIDIEDLYDEFSYGEKSPLAIKAFLARTRPHYVLLVGGATYDPRNYLGRGGLDFVPTKLIDTALLETASDDWFVDLDGNGVPDIPIGRLPVTTLQEATNALSKILAYEQAPPSPKALYVSDIDDTDDTFEETLRPMESLISLVPEELFRAHLGSTMGAVLQARITEGVGLITYLGHGSLQLWDGDIIDTDTPFTNTTYPFIVSMTCLNGYFISPGIDSLASSLVTDTAGAVGMIASSSLTQFAPQAVLGSTILTNLAAGVPVGEALIRAKHAVADPDVQRSYILFGDPSMRVRR